MNLILLIVLNIVICPRTSLPSSYIINTSDRGSNEGLNIPKLRTPVDELLCFIPQNPSDRSSNCPNVLNYQQHEIYNYPQAHPIFNPQYGTYNYSQDQNNFPPQYGTNNNSPQIDYSNSHNNLLLESLNEDQISGENEADITNIIDLVEFDNYHQASNSTAHNNLEFTFRNEVDDSNDYSIIDVVGIDDQHQASLSKKDSKLFNLEKRKLKDEIITSPDGIKKQRTVTECANPINSVCNGLNYKEQRQTKILKDNSFLKMIENYNLPILSHRINSDLLRLSKNVEEITNTTNSQTDDNSIYLEIFKRIVRTVNLLFLSKVNEKRQNSQIVIVSEPKTPFDIFDDDIDFLRKEILEFKQDEYLALPDTMKGLESDLKISLVNPCIHFYDNLKKVALIIYKNNNFDSNIIINNLLYEIRTLKYEIREIRSVIMTIIYYNNLDIKDVKVFLDLFICRMFVLFKTINSIGKTESPIKYLEKTSYFISRIFFNFFYGDEEKHFKRFHKQELSIKSDIDDIIGENNYEFPFITTDLLIFRVLGSQSSIETYNTIINIVNHIRISETQTHFILTNCYNFLLKLRTIGEILVPIKQHCKEHEEMKTRN